MRAIALAALSALLALPASAQDGTVAVTGTPHPVGVYAGVEPGEAQPPPAFGRVGRRARARRGVILTWPGFAPLGNGGSRFFVQTVEPMLPEISVEQGRVVLLFRNTTIHLRNSGRWLETRFFNTPVSRARLERRGRHMALVLHLRDASVGTTPSMTTEVAPGGNFHYVYIDFGPGTYAPVVNVVPESSATVRYSGPPEADAPEGSTNYDYDAMDNEAPPR